MDRSQAESRCGFCPGWARTGRPMNEIVRGEAIFVATGVTKGALLDGVRQEGGFVHTHSIVMASWSCTTREVRMKKKI